MEQINREFKAVVQDLTHIYIGAQMSVEEMISYEDIPFKVKAVFNKYFSKDTQRNRPIGEILGEINKEDFEFQVLKQLKLKFKVGKYTVKGDKEVYKSNTLSVDEFIDLHSSDVKYFDEEVVFNKLALMAFST